MDLNRLYFLHQLSLMRVSSAKSRAANATHQAEADGIARRIGAVQTKLGALAAAGWNQETAR